LEVAIRVLAMIAETHEGIKLGILSEFEKLKQIYKEDLKKGKSAQEEKRT